MALIREAGLKGGLRGRHAPAQHLPRAAEPRLDQVRVGRHPEAGMERPDETELADSCRGRELVQADIAGATVLDELDRPHHRTVLADGRLVPQGLYDRAVSLLGHESVTDMIVLMGYYTAVSLTMNFYAVPAGTPGLAR